MVYLKSSLLALLALPLSGAFAAEEAPVSVARDTLNARDHGI